MRVFLRFDRLTPTYGPLALIEISPVGEERRQLVLCPGLVPGADYGALLPRSFVYAFAKTFFRCAINEPAIERGVERQHRLAIAFFARSLISHSLYA